MSKNEDELLLGTQILTSDESPDSDGDGVSDMQERVEGTNPDDASDRREADPILNPLESADPRDDLERGTIERETVVDPTANMPDGQSIDTGLTGLTNPDGSPLRVGPDHDGVGDDSILDGRLGGNSPLDVQRDPFAPAAGAPGDLPPGFTDPKDEISDKEDPYHDHSKNPNKPDVTPAPPPLDEPEPAPAPDAPAPPGEDEGRIPLSPDLGPDDNVNPDADGGGAPTDAEIERAIVLQGGDTKPVDGDGGTPRVLEDDLPTDPSDPIINKGEGGDLIEVTPLSGALDAPVVNQINPDSGVIVRPPTSGPPPGPDGGDNTGQPSSGSAAMTASDASDGPGISVAGSSGGGIQSIATAGDDVLGTPPADTGATAVDSFAAEYLEDASTAEPPQDAPDVQTGIIIPDFDRPVAEFAEPGADLVTTRLAADLGGDLAPADDDLSAVREDFRAEPLEELAPLDDRDETFDDA